MMMIVRPMIVRPMMVVRLSGHPLIQDSLRKGLEDSNAIGDTDVFVVVPIGGANIHPC